MLDKLQALEEKFMELEAGLSDPAVISDQATFQKYAKAHSAMAEVVSVFREYKRAAAELVDAKELLESSDVDAEMKELARMEYDSLSEVVPELEQKLKVLLLPKDPNDEKNVIVEIRGGTGGDEAALFAGNLFRMYARYAEKHNWKIEIMSSNETELGGFKEIIFAVEGYGAYSRLKFESGVHRVQRVPETEAGGRIHTSAATVAVLPEAEDVDVDLNPNELRIDVYRSTGPGGQSVNTTDSAVRITHVPSGIVVACQDEKSQHKNKDKAMKILRARLLDAAIEKQKSEMDQARKSQVGSGDRSERIRTYNFPQNRCTDHRIGLTLHKLTLIMDGDLDEIIDALVTTEQSERLKNVE